MLAIIKIKDNIVLNFQECETAKWEELFTLECINHGEYTPVHSDFVAQQYSFECGTTIQMYQSECTNKAKYESDLPMYLELESKEHYIHPESRELLVPAISIGVSIEDLSCIKVLDGYDSSSNFLDLTESSVDLIDLAILTGVNPDMLEGKLIHFIVDEESGIKEVQAITLPASVNDIDKIVERFQTLVISNNPGSIIIDQGGLTKLQSEEIKGIANISNSLCGIDILRLKSTA